MARRAEVEYGSAGWIPAAATAAGLCSGVANCRPVMACWNPEMAICMETPHCLCSWGSVAKRGGSEFEDFCGLH